MYKDKEKQREANRLAQARFKAKGITGEAKVIPKTYTDQEFTKLMAQADRKAKPLRVPVPGDADYDGVCLDAKYDSRRMPERPQIASVSQK